MAGTVPDPEDVAGSDDAKVVVVEVAAGARDELHPARSIATATTAEELARP